MLIHYTFNVLICDICIKCINHQPWFPWLYNVVMWVKQCHKLPAGLKTVLMKIEFYNKMCVLPQRGNHLKSGKFGRPNLGVFGGNCVFATVKRDFLGYFDRTNSGIFFTRSFAASLQSSQAASCTFWWISVATFWHIRWYLCAWHWHPKSWGWIVCSWSTQHQSCLYGILWWSGRAGHPSQIRSVATCNVCSVATCNVARIPQRPLQRSNIWCTQKKER